ncbi:MAG: TolC family outer membrane protein, partial [Parvularculaceae bacterium]|nr:TolC family outer membrane protein [Parvularculaceae bacterium]
MTVTRLKLFCAAAAAAIAFCGEASAEAEKGMLEDALAAAYQGNPSLKAERANLRIVDEGESAAWSFVRPQISANANYTYTHLNRESPFQSLNSQREQQLGSVYAGFTVQQPLMQGMRNVNAIRKARADVRAERARLVDAEQKLLTATTEAYVDVRVEKAVLELNRNNARVLETALAYAQGRFKLQSATRTDVAQAEARLAKARADVIAAEARYESARARFAEQTGAPPPDALAEPRPLATMPKSEEDAQDLAVQHAPAVLVAQATEQASKRAVGVAKGELAPKIVAEAGYSYAQDQTFEGDRSRSYYAGLRATVPLYDGGLTHARVRQAKQTLQRDQYLTAQTLRALQTDIREAWVAHQAASAAARAAAAEVAASEVAAEGVRKENVAGRRTTLDVLNAEQELLNARTSELRAGRDAYVAGIRLLAAAGLYTAETIGLDVERYDPKRYRKRATLGAVGI